MLVVSDSVVFEEWTPDFSSSGQASPRWTRMLLGRHVLANALEWIEWDPPAPVQVVLCEACGYEGCDTGGFVNVVRLGDFVLWTGAFEQDDEQSLLAPVQLLGALAFRERRWIEWRDRFPLPSSAALPPAAHRDAAEAWIRGPGRSDVTAIVARLREHLVGGDTLDRDAAIALVERSLAPLLARADQPFEGDVLDARAMNARIETLYFDGPAEEDWPAFAFSDGKVYLALDRETMVEA